MAVIKLDAFTGENRALHPTLLPDGMGVTSTNHRPGRGDLRPWNAASNVASVSSGSQTIYRMGLDVASDTNYWLAWNTAVNVVRGFNADDPTERTYYTGSGYPKWTDTTKALASAPYPTSYRSMGIPAPASACTVSAPTLTITAGSFVVGKSYVIVSTGTTNFTTVGAADSNVGTVFTATGVGSGTGTVRTNNPLETRYYTYTYVSDVGEESAPAPASVAVSCRTDDVATLNNFAAVPSGPYGINRIRIYRTAVGSTSAAYYFLREVATTTTIAATAMTNGVVYTIVTLGTTNFTSFGAPYNAVGVSFTATGAGTGSGTVSYSTVSTANTTDDLRTLGEVIPTLTWTPAPGVPQGGAANVTEPTLTGLTGMWNGMMAGISGRAVRVCEPYTPYAWPVQYEILPSESSPKALGVFGQTLVVLTNAHPIMVTGGSPDALDEQPVQFLQPCVSVASVVSMGHGVVWASPDGLCYIGAGGPRVLTEGIMTRDDWQAIVPSTIVGGMYEDRYIGFYTVASVTKGFVCDPRNTGGLYFLDFGATATYFDQFQQQLYLLNGTNVQKWNAGSALTVTFKSKVFQAPKPASSFSVAQVLADAYPCTFKLYADGVLKHTETVASRNPFRLPADYYADRYQVEVSSVNPIQKVLVANSMQELRAA